MKSKIKNDIPLCVDLDQTFIKTNILLEGLVILLKKKPWHVFNLPLWLLRGKSYLKKKIFDHVDLNITQLPLNMEIVNFCQSEFGKDRNVYLVTGTYEEIAKCFKENFTFFADVFGTTDQVNLVGKNKANFLISKFGQGKFDYIGDCKDDYPVYSVARKSYHIGKSEKLKKKIQNLEKIFYLQVDHSLLFHLLKQIRVHQWVKNLLVFLPMILIHYFSSLEQWWKLVMVFFSFSFTASAIYCLNDLTDLSHDRIHPEKKNRPLAKGDLPLSYGIICALILFFMGISFSYFLGESFFFIILTYIFTNFLYSFKIKKIPILDVFLLTFFYILRLMAGGLVVDVPISPWLKMFSFFIFLSLAFLKRFTEIKFYVKEANFGRGYENDDASIILNMGLCSSFSATLIYSLYIFQNTTKNLYSNPDLLWLAVPLILYWKIGLWYKASKGMIVSDPVKYILSDISSIITFILICIIFIKAI